MRRKIRNFFALIVTVICLALMITACSGQPQFELFADSYSFDVTQGDSFCVHVYTKNIGKDYKYRGSSTKIGASASIYTETDSGRIYLNHNLIMESADIVPMVFKHNETVIRAWYFHTKNDETPEGSYTLSLKFLDKEELFPDFIKIISN